MDADRTRITLQTISSDGDKAITSREMENDFAEMVVANAIEAHVKHMGACPFLFLAKVVDEINPSLADPEEAIQSELKLFIAAAHEFIHADKEYTRKIRANVRHDRRPFAAAHAPGPAGTGAGCTGEDG